MTLIAFPSSQTSPRIRAAVQPRARWEAEWLIVSKMLEELAGRRPIAAEMVVATTRRIIGHVNAGLKGGA